MKTLYSIGHEMESRGVSHCIIAGDVFHRRGSVPTVARQVFYDWLVWMRDKYSIKIIVMTGNHDQEDKLGEIHSLYDLKDACTVIDTPLKEDFGGANIVFLPYMENKDDILHCLERLDLSLEDDEKPDLFVGHLGIEGAYVGPIEYKIKSPITWKDLGANRFRWVVLGHYHKPQKIGPNGFYIGSPGQINRGERGETKRWMLFDPETKKLTSISTGAKEFLTITSSELLAGKLDQHYYDVVLDSFASSNEVAEAASNFQVKLIKPRVENTNEARIKLHEGMTDQQLLQAYCFHKEVNDKNVNLGMAILNESTQEISNYAKMDFLKLVVNNFLAIERASLELNRAGRVTAVLGDNRDRTGYDSNGSGKSALLPEAIFWCLYGKTARKLPADKVVHRKIKRNCSVECFVRLDKKILRVLRYRKHTKYGGTGLRLWLSKEEITQGTPELTEIKLKELLGIDYTTFSSVIAFSPDNLRFVSSTDSNQKQVLDSILQTRRFSAALVLAKDMKSEVAKTRLISISSKETTEGVLRTLYETLDDYNTRNSEFGERELARAKSLSEQADELAEQIIELEATATTVVEKCEELKRELGGRDAEALTEARDNAVQVLADKKACMRAINNSIDQFQDKLDEALEQAGKPCPTCGQTVSNTGKLIASYQRDRNTLLSGKVVGEREIVQAEEQLTQTKADLQVALDLAKQQQVFGQLSSRNREFKVRAEKLLGELDNKPVNEYDTLIPKVMAQVDELQDKVVVLNTAIAKSDKQVAKLEFWIQAFGNSGIRSFLLDQILPDLTAYANEYSDVLTGGGIDISFESYNEETLKDKFKIKAINEDGSDIYEGNSSGEKRRVDICVMFALFRIAHTRTRVNLLLLDEVLDTLDGSGLENVVDLLQKLANELGLGVYVTSHTSLNSMLHESITLEKHDGKTTLTQ